MLASATAVGLTRMASSAGYVGSRRAGLQFELVSSRTVRDTIRPTLPSSGASTVGRLKSRQVRLWTATAVAGQPAPSASHPSASRSCAALERSDQVHGDTPVRKRVRPSALGGHGQGHTLPTEDQGAFAHARATPDRVVMHGPEAWGETGVFMMPALAGAPQLAPS